MSKVYPHGRDRQSRRSYTHGNKSSSLGTQQGPIKVTPELTKSLMSRIAHPVAVVTTSLRTEELEEHHRETDGGHSPHLEKLCAMTVSSINTVTVSPETVLAFNIRLPSKTFTALSRGRQFLVHFLTASRQGRGIGEFFAKGKASYGFSRMDDVKMNWKCNDAADGAPQITDPAVLACVRCTIMLDKCVYVGDHVLVLAKAQDITIGDGQVESGSLEFQGGPGLSYMLRDYRYMGSPIEGLMSSGRLK